MARITRKKVCPHCGVVDFTRRHRSLWMRLFPNSRHYQCRHCRTNVLLIGTQDEPPEEDGPAEEKGDSVLSRH